MNYYPPPVYAPQYTQYQNQLLQQNQQATMSGNLISVHSEEEARMYPIQPGHSVTFKDENQPYIYTKTMGFSQLDRPVFEKYKLIKEELPAQSTATPVDDKYALKNDLADLVNKVMDLQEELLALKGEDHKRQEAT